MVNIKTFNVLTEIKGNLPRCHSLLNLCPHLNLKKRIYALLIAVAMPPPSKKINQSFNPVTSAKYLIRWQGFFIMRTDENQRKTFKTDFWQNMRFRTEHIERWGNETQSTLCIVYFK